MVLIEKEKKLLEITAYINLRPKLEVPPYNISIYAYSSYLAYIRESGAAGGPDITEEIKEVLTYLKGNTYREIVDQIDLNKLSEVDKELATKPIIGSDKFVKDVKSKMKTEKNVSIESPESVSEPETEPEPMLEPEPEPEPQPEPEPEQLLEPEPATPVIASPVRNTISNTAGPGVSAEAKGESALANEDGAKQSIPEIDRNDDGNTNPKPNMMKYTAIASLVIITISASILFLNAKITRMKAHLDKELAGKDVELKGILAEKVSYQETARRLESEKETFKAEAARLEAEKNTYQEMANRLSDEKVSYQQAAERLESEKKKIEEELASIRKAAPEPVKNPE